MKKYSFDNSTILEPNYIPQYCSDDGNYVVIPMVGDKKWMLIVEGKQINKVYRKFDTALKDVLKYQKKNSKSKSN